MAPATATEEATTAVVDQSVDQRHAADSHQLQLVTFEVGKEEFAVDILTVQEINRMLQITHVPQSPPDVEGVINLRGRIIPVVDLRKRFGMPAVEHNSESRIIVVEVSGRVIGFVVDRVHEVLRIDSSIVDPAPEMASAEHSEYIMGVGKLQDRLLILLDLEKLFGNAELKQIDQTVAASQTAE
jgi:purine-binding chemotaxis protein CheW